MCWWFDEEHTMQIDILAQFAQALAAGSIRVVDLTQPLEEPPGTHFDTPVHWVTGKDYPQNTTDTIPVEKFFAHACVLDMSAQVAENADFLLTPQHVLDWEEQH